MKLPKYIYHYTTIETLALILKSSEIRFNSIGNLDDTTESITDDVGNISAFALVSCWTDSEEENISLWNMYCKNGRGVRIRMRPTLFNKNIAEKSDSFYGLDKMLLWPFNSLFKIDYVDNPKRNIRGLEPGILDINKLGKIKERVWQFQKEWRFIIYQMPEDEILQRMLRNELSEVTDILNTYKFQHDFFYISILNDELKHMEVTLGPSATSAEKIIVEALVDKFCPEVKIINSKLKDKVRFK